MARLLGRGGRHIGQFVPSALVLASLVALWELVVVVIDLPRYFLVAPSEVAGYLVKHAGFFVDQSMTTIVESVAGLLVGSVMGVVLATMLVYSQTLSRILMPLIVGSQVVPKPAIAPLLVVWMGYGAEPKILIAALIAFFPVVMDHAYGLRSVPKELLDLGNSLGAGGWRLFLKIRLPHSLPALFSGLKVASSLAVIGAVVGEFVGATSGLGYQITLAGFRIDTPLLLSCLVLLVIIGVALYGVIALLERLVIPWARVE
jgi:NitT/TauT family transport system permease protein